MLNFTVDNVQTLCDLAIENEKIEREVMAAMWFREEGATTLIKALQNGLCKASRLARQMQGLPSIREENRQLEAQEQDK